jgi:hypothetical protein
LSLRRPGRRHLVAIGIAAVLGVVALGFAQQVRNYSASTSTGQAVRIAARTPVGYWFGSDLSTFDNFVALRLLVPGSVEYLDGESLAAIPTAVVPRSVWHGKPAALDVRAASYLYPGSGAAVPVSLQGELYWNAGLPAVAAGMALMGLLMGLFACAGWRVHPGSGWFVLYASALPFTHAFLTRGLATMTANLVFALIGVGTVVVVVGGGRVRQASLRIFLPGRA